MSAVAFSCIPSKMLSAAFVAKGWCPLPLCSCESRQSAVRFSEQQLKVNFASKQEGSKLQSKARLSYGGIGASDPSKRNVILLRSLPSVAVSIQDEATLKNEAPPENEAPLEKAAALEVEAPLEKEAALEVEAPLENEAAIKNEAPPESLDIPLVKVKFVLQKKCLFGQKFSVVGEDILLGAWNPNAGFDLDWSKDHVWTGEFDLPPGKKYEFKFLLTSEDGEVHWQPGPNRTFETLENALPLIVSEPWNPEETDKIDDVPADVTEALSIPGDIDVGEPNLATEATKGILDVGQDETGNGATDVGEPNLATEATKGILDVDQDETGNGATDVGEPNLATEATKGILDVDQDETGNGATDVGEPNLVTEATKGILDVKQDETENGVTVAAQLESVVAALLLTSTGNTEEQQTPNCED